MSRVEGAARQRDAARQRVTGTVRAGASRRRSVENTAALYEPVVAESRANHARMAP
jgi:hypothetical protein